MQKWIGYHIRKSCQEYMYSFYWCYLFQMLASSSSSNILIHWLSHSSQIPHTEWFSGYGSLWSTNKVLSRFGLLTASIHFFNELYLLFYTFLQAVRNSCPHKTTPVMVNWTATKMVDWNHTQKYLLRHILNCIVYHVYYNCDYAVILKLKTIPIWWERCNLLCSFYVVLLYTLGVMIKRMPSTDLFLHNLHIHLTPLFFLHFFSSTEKASSKIGKWSYTTTDLHWLYA